jgi:hypothetical protein
MVQTWEQMCFELMKISRSRGGGSVTAEEIKKAGEKVAKTRDQKLAWALRFADLDLQKLTAGDWVNVCLEAATFHGHLLRISSQVKGTERLPLYSPAFPSKEDIERIHQAFNHLLKICKSPSSVLTEIDCKVTFEFSNDQGTYSFSRSIPKYVDACKVEFMELLAEYSEIVRICPKEKGGCGRWFLASRVDREYCCTRCTTNAMSRRLRARQKARKGRKHAKR